MKHTRTLEVYYVNLSEGNCFPVNRVSTSTIFWEIQTTRMSWPVSQLGKPSNPRVTRRPFRYFWSKPAIITGHGGRRNRTLHSGSDDYDETWGVGKPRVGRVETERAGTGGTNRVKEKKKMEKEKAEIWFPMPPDCQSYPNRAHPLCRDKMSLFCFFSLLVLSTTWHDFIGLFLSLQKSTLILNRAQGIRISKKPQPLCNLTFYLYSTLSSEVKNEEGFLS
jgi:hypothetical protein